MHRIRSGKIAAPTKHLEKGRGMKSVANRLLRREGHEAMRGAVDDFMQTYAVEDATDQFEEFLELLRQGHEVTLTENGIAIAKAVPPTEDDIAWFEKSVQE